MLFLRQIYIYKLLHFYTNVDHIYYNKIKTTNSSKRGKKDRGGWIDY